MRNTDHSTQFFEGITLYKAQEIKVDKAHVGNLICLTTTIQAIYFMHSGELLKLISEIKMAYHS